MSRPEIICFGEAMVELSSISDDSCKIGIGGDTFNTAVYLARAGHQVAYASAVGDCPFSEKLLSSLKVESISTELLPSLPDHSVGLYAISLDNVGERSFTYWRSESAVRSLLKSPEANRILMAFRDAPVVYFSGITLSLFSTDERQTLFDILLERKTAGLLTVFDGNYRPGNWDSVETARHALDRAVALSTWTLPTFDDEALLFGDKSPEETAQRHLALGASEVIVKHGAKGALVGSGRWIAPRKVVKPHDTTGAGDSFNAAYLSARLNKACPEEAALAGHDLASRVLMVPGAIISVS